MKPNFKGGHPFSKHLFAVEMGKTEITMLCKLCYMDTDSFVYEIETKDFYRDIAKDVEKRFDTSGYSKDDNRPLPIAENIKKIGLMKDELGGKIMTELVTLKAKKWRKSAA